MSASFHSIHQDEIDGVPTYWMDVPGPLSAALIFRVGRADEIPARYGITHLVEHLALAPLGVQDYEHNGGVESLRTVFEVAGSRADVARFLADITLVGIDAIKITIDAADWRNGQQAIALIDAATPQRAFACASHSDGGLEDPEGRT